MAAQLKVSIKYQFVQFPVKTDIIVFNPVASTGLTLRRLGHKFRGISPSQMQALCLHPGLGYWKSWINVLYNHIT